MIQLKSEVQTVEEQLLQLDRTSKSTWMKFKRGIELLYFLFFFLLRIAFIVLILVKVPKFEEKKFQLYVMPMNLHFYMVPLHIFFEGLKFNAIIEKS